MSAELSTPLPSHKWIIQIMQLVVLHKPVDLDFFYLLLTILHVCMYIFIHMCVCIYICDQYSQACLGTVVTRLHGQLWLLIKCFTTAYGITGQLCRIYERLRISAPIIISEATLL